MAEFLNEKIAELYWIVFMTLLSLHVGLSMYTHEWSNQSINQ